MSEPTTEQKLYRRWQAFLQSFGMVATGPSGPNNRGGGNGNTVILLLLLLLTFLIFVHAYL